MLPAGGIPWRRGDHVLEMGVEERRAAAKERAGQGGRSPSSGLAGGEREGQLRVGPNLVPEKRPWPGEGPREGLPCGGDPAPALKCGAAGQTGRAAPQLLSPPGLRRVCTLWGTVGKQSDASQGHPGCRRARGGDSEGVLTAAPRPCAEGWRLAGRAVAGRGQWLQVSPQGDAQRQPGSFLSSLRSAMASWGCFSCGFK